MIRGLYTSGYSMITLNRKMDTVANNMANVNTNGFKKDNVVFEEFSDVLAQRLYDTTLPTRATSNIGRMTMFNDVASVHTDYTQGAFEDTHINTDVSINGDDSAFFTVAVQDNEGNFREYYTRDGSFKLNADGMLVTKDGYPVMGNNGPIYLEGNEFTISSKGEITQKNQVIDTLKIKKVENPESLRKYGYNLLSTTDESTDGTFNGTVLQGFTERSNVDSIKEMVDMIAIMRAYESNQKLIQYQDSTLDKAVNEIGRVG